MLGCTPEERKERKDSVFKKKCQKVQSVILEAFKALFKIQ